MLTFAVKSRRTPGALLVNDIDAAAILGVSRATLWRLKDAKKAPKPIKLGRRTLWRVAELEAMCQRS